MHVDVINNILKYSSTDIKQHITLITAYPITAYH